MSDDPINIQSNSEGSAFSSSKMRMEPESHYFPSICGDFKSEIISLINILKWKECLPILTEAEIEVF